MTGPAPWFVFRISYLVSRISAGEPLAPPDEIRDTNDEIRPRAYDLSAQRCILRPRQGGRLPLAGGLQAARSRPALPVDRTRRPRRRSRRLAGRVAAGRRPAHR